MAQTTHETKRALDEIASELREPTTSTVDLVVRDDRRRRWLQAVAAGYATMSKSPADWADELAEREQWDETVADGLAEE